MTLNEDEYFVKRVAGRVHEGDVRKFLIEWDNYAKEESTWEVEANLLGNTQLINDFEHQLLSENPTNKNIVLRRDKVLLKDAFDPEADIPKPQKRKTFKLYRKLKDIEEHSENRQRKQSRKETTEKAAMDKNGSKKVSKLDDFVVIFDNKVQPVTKDGLVLTQLLESIKASYVDAQKQGHPLVLCNGQQTFENIWPPVTVVNTVDDDTLPKSFTYISSLVYSRDVKKPDPNFLVGCECSPSCLSYPCPEPCHDTIAYNKHGRVQINQGEPIYECNTACQCDPESCTNRVVQRGRQVPLQIFKTKKKGWGVRSTSSIGKGQFVEEYLGEVITENEGEFRGLNIYDKFGSSYLFNMDFMSDNDIEIKYVIDSFILGNASHFFNHSCEPNLTVYVVYHDSGDPQFHRVAFFANRNIRKGEELTFDYNGCTDNTIALSSTASQMTLAGMFPCYCDASSCRKRIHK